MRRLFILLFIHFIAVSLIGQDLPWSAESPSPDGYGYTWKTNTASGGPVYSWIDITNTGTVVEGLGDDNFVGPFALGIDFQFYWLDKTEVWISSNGHISFAPFNIASSQAAGGFAPLPNSGDGKNDIIAPYLADLNVGQNEGGNPNLGQVLYYSDQAANKFIVTYKNIPYWVNNADGWQGANTFQVILDGNDNTITYQYQTMFGEWAPSYNQGDYPFTVGIEAITGTFGLSATGEAKVTPADRPVNGTAIKFIPPSSPGPVVDVEVSELGPSGKQGFFVPWNPFPLEQDPSFRLKGKVRNLGSATISSSVVVQVEVTDSLELLYVSQRDTIFGGFQPLQEKDFEFSDVFYPPFENTYSYKVTVMNGNDFGDVFAGNNSTTVEMITIDTSKTDIILSYNGRDEATNVSGPTITSGDDGSGVLFEPPAYPAELKNIQMVLFGLANADPIVPGEDLVEVAVYGVSTDGSIPGPELYRKTINQTELADQNSYVGDYFNVSLPTPLTISEGGFYIGVFQLTEKLGLGFGLIPPISGRSYEVLSGTWSPNRNATTQEFYIRAVIGLDDNAVYTPIDKEIEDLHTFSVYPNPNNGRFALEVGLENPSELGIKIFDLAGNKVYLGSSPMVQNYKREIDLSYLSSGMYILQISTAKGQQSQRIFIR